MLTLMVEKEADLMRATLIAFGLAHFFYDLAEQDILIQDAGSMYLLDVPISAEACLAEVRRRGYLPQLLPAIKKAPSTAEKKELEAQNLPLETASRKYIPSGFQRVGQVVDYEAERQKEEANRKVKVRQEGEALTRPPEYPLWAHLCSYFGKGSAMRVGYPLVLHTWYQHQGELAEKLCELILETYTQFPNPIHEAATYWKEQFLPQFVSQSDDPFDWRTELLNDVTGYSVVSPTTVQGHYSLSGSAGLVNNPQTLFWLELYLAFAGYMAVGMPYRGKDGDVILYYPLPKSLYFSKGRDLMQKYQQSNFAYHLYSYSGLLPRAKIDALCHILYHQEIVQNAIATIENVTDGMVDNLDEIAGLVGYYYKDISTQIPFDETTFAFPLWLSTSRSLDELENARENLDEHKALVNSLRGENADELVILTHYRRFITYNHPDDWIAFVISYGLYNFRRMAEGSFNKVLLFKVLKETLMNNDRKDYTPILDNTGFQNIAKAIRACTVQLRYFKDVKKQPTNFKVWHGLGDDLRRRAHNPDDFIEDLSNFVHRYTQESSNVQVDTGDTRAFIREDDLYEVIALVKEYGSRVVANLLVAAGYASNPKD